MKMKLSLCSIFMLMPLVAFSQQPDQNVEAAPQPSLVEVEGIPSTEEYKKALEDVTSWTKKVDKLEAYKDVTLRRGDKLLKFVDLEEVDQHLFMILSGQKCSNIMMDMWHKWTIERKQLLRIEVLRQGGRAAEAAEGEITSEQLAKFLTDLRKVQKSHAKNFESMIIKIIEKYKDEIPKEDGELYLSNVRKFHDKFDLIERSDTAGGEDQ